MRLGKKAHSHVQIAAQEIYEKRDIRSDTSRIIFEKSVEEK